MKVRLFGLIEFDGLKKEKGRLKFKYQTAFFIYLSDKYVRPTIAIYFTFVHTLRNPSSPDTNLPVLSNC